MEKPIARRTEKLYVKDKVLFVKLNSAPLRQELTMKKRYLKVRDTYYEHHLKKWPRPPSVPIIHLKGYWLNQIGFEIGKQLKLTPKGQKFIDKSFLFLYN